MGRSDENRLTPNETTVNRCELGILAWGLCQSSEAIHREMAEFFLCATHSDVKWLDGTSFASKPQAQPVSAHEPGSPGPCDDQAPDKESQNFQPIALAGAGESLRCRNHLRGRVRQAATRRAGNPAACVANARRAGAARKRCPCGPARAPSGVCAARSGASVAGLGWSVGRTECTLAAALLDPSLGVSVAARRWRGTPLGC